MDYLPIDTGVLVDMSPLKADVYIRLSEEKFLKLFLAGDAFDHADLAKYRDQKHVEHLYFRTEDVSAFLEQVNHDLDEKLRLPDDQLDIETVRKSAAAVHSALQTLPDALGLPPSLQEATRKQVALTYKSIRFHWKMSSILKQLTDEGGYLAAHSLALSYVACMILSKTQWAGELNGQKLCFAALLHDIALHDQRLAVVETMAELEKRRAEFTEEDQKNFLYHTVRASERASKFDAIPPDVPMIVMHHHERPDGSGFPRHLKFPQIPPLSAVFIIAHELIYFARRHGKGFEMAEFLPTVEPLHEGHFAHIIEAIQFE